MLSRQDLSSRVTQILRNVDLPSAQVEFAQRVYANGLEAYLERLADLGLTGLGRVLDLGAGFGQWATALALRNEQVFASDISSERLAFTSRISRENGLANVHCVAADVLSQPFGSESFDAIFAYSVLPLVDWRRALVECHRLLKASGMLYVNVNGLGWYLYLWETEHNKSRDYDPRTVAARAFHDTLEYSRTSEVRPGSSIIIEPDDLADMALSAGYEVLGQGPEGSICSPGLTSNSRARSFLLPSYRGFIGVHEALLRKI